MPPSSSAGQADAQAIRELAAAHERLTEQFGKVVLGQKALVEQLLILREAWFGASVEA